MLSEMITANGGFSALGTGHTFRSLCFRKKLPQEEPTCQEGAEFSSGHCTAPLTMATRPSLAGKVSKQLGTRSPPLQRRSQLHTGAQLGHHSPRVHAGPAAPDKAHGKPREGLPGEEAQAPLLSPPLGLQEDGEFLNS